MTNFESVQIKKYDSVGGWLLFLCLALTIFSPLRTIYNFVTTFEEASSLFNDYPGMQAIFYVDLFLSVILTILSVRAGLALWQIKPGAVKTAKNYLLIFMGYSVLSSFLPFMAGLPSEANVIMLAEVFKGIMQSLVFFVVWYWYLSVSKRVKATYVAYTYNEVPEIIVEETGNSENNYPEEKNKEIN